MTPPSFNRVHIDLHALQHNYRLLRNKADKSAFLAMVKADGYGHGMVACTRALEDAGCRIFGVAELREAVVLREAGVVSAIFVMMGFKPDDAPLICRHELTPVVYDLQSIEALSRAACNTGRETAVHVKVDIGMGRLGIALDEIEMFVQTIERLPGLKFGGIAGHFPSSDDVTSSSTSECLARFKTFINRAGNRVGAVAHSANSGATLYFPETHCDMVRCGISLYGYYPEGDTSVTANGLRPVMSFTTQVLQVKDMPAGTGISYGHTYVTTRLSRIAVLPVGYEDGFSRDLSNCGEVLIRGRRAPVRGRVCMNLCMVDVTDIDAVQAGDEVVIIGTQGDESITADELASRIGSISYEVLCMIGNNNERE